MDVIRDEDVDVALWPLVEGFPPIDVSADTLAAFRAAMIEMSVKPDPATHPDVHVTEVQIFPRGSSRDIRALFIAPATPTGAGALLHIHGGGYVMGTVAMDVARNVALARDTGCAILSLDYRLAPEHPHPAGLEDCHDALVWLASRSSGPLGVIGESAGGGLAASLALLARDRGSVALACQVLIYPMLMPPAHSLDATSPDERTGRHIWTRASNGYCWSAYLSGGHADPATIAGLASDLSRLPPTFVAVGALDLFVHDDLAHAARLLRAGCAVEAHLYPGAIHAFDRVIDAPVTLRFTRELSDFIRRHLGPK